MATNLDIDPELLIQVQQAGRYRTKREAVEAAFVGDHLEAAAFNRTCRSAGVTAGVTAGAADALVVALARRLGTPIFATDADFEHMRRVIPFQPS